MPKPPSTWTTVTVGMSKEEKQHVDECAKASGMTRNRFIRDVLAALRARKGG